MRVVAVGSTSALRRHSDALRELAADLAGLPSRPSWVTGWIDQANYVWRQVFGEGLSPPRGRRARRISKGALRRAREDAIAAVWERAEVLDELREVLAADPDQMIRDLGLATARLMRETTHAGTTAHDQRPHRYPLRDPRSEPEHSARVTGEVG